MLAGQLRIDFEYDERTVRLAAEFAIMISPYLAVGTKTETTKTVAANLAKLASRRIADRYAPAEPIRCHTCDEMTTLPDNRVRVAVCNRCASEGRSPGSTG
jgi:hypothetical protein